MVKIFDADLVKGHFIVTDNGKRILIDTGCPFVINDENKRTIPMGEHIVRIATSDGGGSSAKFTVIQ